MSTVTLTKWGNSIGIRIPAAIMKQAHLVSGEELSITVSKTGRVILMPIKNFREGWTEKFNAIADAKQDELLFDLSNEFDNEEWTW